MSLGKQAKILTPAQQKAVLNYLESSRQPERNKLIFLLSVKAGLRSKEIASLQWSMVTNAEGEILDRIALPNSASKGKSGRIIWISQELQIALREYRATFDEQPDLSRHIISTERARKTSPQVITNWFWSHYRRLGFEGASSHSGRRTAITSWAKKISIVGGSLRDVQMLAGHTSLQMTQRYVEHDSEAQRRVV
ncbi:MAG: site-specific integrase [Rickettsiales bacterium]|nr:site-specific integrase [Rickettsiales bacterium]